MDERQIKGLIDEVAAGRLPRRSFIQRMVGLGLTRAHGLDDADERRHGPGADRACPTRRTKRGGGGTLKLIWWQGAVHLQPALRRRHQGAGRDAHLLRAARRLGQRRQPDPVRWRPRSRAAPTAASRPTARSVTWKLKRDVTWHDGKPFTADDVLFTAAYAGDPATATVTVAVYKDIKVEKIDSHTVRIDVREADAVLGRALRRQLRHDPAQARVRAVHRRQEPRGTRPTSNRSAPARTSSSTSSRAT